MKGLVKFIKNSVDELQYKVTWPTYDELQSSTILVIIGSVLFALLIGLMDFGFNNILKAVYNF